MQLRSTRLTAISSAVKKLFNPTSLFSAGEQGVWYDPSDMSTMFQDSAGTTPVTAVEQPVGRILDKSGRGNHATQTTTTSRPVLSARVNLLMKTEQFDEAAWTKTFGATVIANVEENADKVVAGTSLASQILTQGSIPALPNTTYKLSIKAKKAGYRYFYFAIVGAPTAGRIFDFDTGSYTATQTGTATYESQLLSDGFYLLTQTFTTSSSVGDITAELGIRATPSFNAFTGDGVSGALVKEADLRLANTGVNLPAYQRVNTATDYDTAGFPMYLRFDGVDDWLVTPSINFTSTDKMTVFAGVRKLSDGTVFGTLIELGSNIDVTTNGSIRIIANGTSNFNLGFSYDSRGTIPATAKVNFGVFPAPTTLVAAGISQISTDTVILRVNGTQVAAGTTDQGTGNYRNLPLFIGRRNGDSFPFNGHLYSLIVRGAQSTAQQVSDTETWVNGKTKAY